MNRLVKIAGAIALGTLMAAFPLAAAADGWVQTAQNVTQLSDEVQKTIMGVAGLIGVFSFVYAGILIKKKSNDNTAREVKVSHIIMAVVAGVVLIALAMVVKNSVQTAGGASSDVGRRTIYNGSGW